MNLNNSEKNTYARNQIMQSTLQLLEEKELGQISISEISNISTISRVTIYRNFASKEEIVKAYIYQVFQHWIGYHAKSSTRADMDSMLARLFGIIQEHKSLFLLLQKRNLLTLFREMLKEVLGPSQAQENFTAYLSAFYFSGLFGWIEEWLHRGMQESMEEIESYLKNRVIL